MQNPWKNHVPLVQTPCTIRRQWPVCCLDSAAQNYRMSLDFCVKLFPVWLTSFPYGQATKQLIELSLFSRWSLHRRMVRWLVSRMKLPCSTICSMTYQSILYLHLELNNRLLMDRTLGINSVCCTSMKREQRATDQSCRQIYKFDASTTNIYSHC